ncbi:aquaporin-like protein, partial [Gonapodya prolifera JEL478]
MTDKRRVLVRAVAGEFLVTFLFLFVVMSVGVNFRRANPTEADATLGGISTGFTAVALIYSFADVSGAHFNPAVTMGTIVTGKVSVKKGLWFIGIQLSASIMATLWLQVVFPPHRGFNASEIAVVDFGDKVVIGRAFAMEATLTFILVYVIFATAFETVDTNNKVLVKPVADGAQKSATVNPNGAGREVTQDASVGKNLTIYTTSANSKSGFAPLAIGLTLGFLCFLGGSVSGGAFNPARVFGPAIVTGNWNNHWVYWIG